MDFNQICRTEKFDELIVLDRGGNLFLCTDRKRRVYCLPGWAADLVPSLLFIWSLSTARCKLRAQPSVASNFVHQNKNLES